MGILQDKKIAVILALIVIMVGSIVYFVMDVPKNDDLSMNDDLSKEVVYDGNSSTTTANFPMIENEAII